MKPTNERAKKKTKIRSQIEKKEKRKKYSDESLQKALKEIENGMPKKKAAQMFQVPRATLQFRIKHPDHKPLPGPNTVLSIEEENKIKQWLINCSKKGFPKRKEDILHSVMEFLNENQRPNPFKENVPGDKWFKLFLKRHPDIAIRAPEAVTPASAVVSQKDIKNWFHGIELYLREQNLFEILSDPKRVLNGDETNFLLCAKTGVVLAPKGAKNVYEVDHGQAKSSLTVMFTFRASGELTPPMVIFPYKRVPAEIKLQIPPDWGIGHSDNGWMKTEIFCDYIENILYPYLIKTETVFPVIVFVDGHKTHLTYAVSEICSSLNIVLIALYPNCTRVLQPADVSAFRPLKGGWRKTVLEWRRENPAKALTKQDFIPLLKNTIKKSIKPETIVNGFRTTGLFPWNPEAIDYTKCLGKSCRKNDDTTDDTNQSKAENGKLMTKQDFRSIVGKTVIEILESDKELTETEMILKKLWEFFSASEMENVETEITIENIDDSVTQNVSENKMILAETHQKHTGECCTAKQPPEHKQEKSVREREDMNVESMNVVICEDTEILTSYIPVSHEVVIEEITLAPSENSIAKNNTDTGLNLQETTEESDDDSQNTHCVNVIHKAQIETHIDRNDSTNLGTREKSTKEIITNVNNQDFDKIEVLSDEDNYQIETHRDRNDSTNLGTREKSTKEIITNGNNQDFDKIEVLSVEDNYKLTTPVKVNLIKRVCLDDILKNPKTPERKGIKQVKRTSFVITSTDVKEEQLKKLKEKEEKEENIRKRKEKREQKKLLLEKTKQLKKQAKVNSKKVKVTKKKTDNLQTESKKTPDDVKKKLFSEDFTNMNLDITLNPQQSDAHLQSTEEETIKQKDDCTYIEKKQGKFTSKYDKTIKPVITKLTDNIKDIKVKLEPACPNRQIKTNRGKIDTKNELKKILYSQEFMDMKEDDEGAPDKENRQAKKFCISEIEKMLSD